jgi:Na+/melibiose symporter-like transporter
LGRIVGNQSFSTDAWRIYTYFAPLAVLLYVVDPLGPSFDIAVTYVLKDHLHATLSEVATFRLFTALPVYASCLFGLMRDRWSPFGLGDRGYFLLFAPLLVAVMGWLAAQPLTLARLSGGVVLALVFTRFVVAAYQGRMARVAQEQAMSGRLACAWQFTTYGAALLSAAGAGWASTRLTPPSIFLVVAVASMAIALCALWQPRSVYAPADVSLPTQRSDLASDLTRLRQHRAIYPVVAAMLMFQFSPGQGVVLQYYLVDRLHGSNAMYGVWYAAFLAGFLPMFLVYGYLCARMRFRRLLWVSALIAVPQMLPLAFIHSAEGAVALAVPIGMMGGLMWVAIHDLAMRACPSGLQGTLMMLVSGANALGVRGGDLIGARLYALGGEQGYWWCVIVTTLMYGAILGVLRWVPLEVMGPSEGKPRA